MGFALTGTPKKYERKMRKFQQSQQPRQCPPAKVYEISI
jgi:hypothetical protein